MLVFMSMIHLLRLPHYCVGVNYCVRVDCSTLQLIIPLSINADVYAYALLLAATLLCMIACFIVWYVNRYCELMNVSAYLDSLDSL